MAETRSEAILIYDTKLRFALLNSLRSASLSEILWTTNWSLYPQGSNFKLPCFQSRIAIFQKVNSFHQILGQILLQIFKI